MGSDSRRAYGSGGAAHLAGRRSVRLKDPVRRAFTLPSMLCHTLVAGRPSPDAGRPDEGSRLLLSRLLQIYPAPPVDQKIADPRGLPGRQLDQQQAHNDDPINSGAGLNNKLGLASINSLSCLATPIRARAHQNHRPVAGEFEATTNGGALMTNCH